MRILMYTTSFVLGAIVGFYAYNSFAEELDCNQVNLGEYDYTDVSTNRPTRNNNPGNIRKTKRNYYGETSNDPAFESFATPEWGYAAMFDLLDRLYSGLTLSEAIYKWAPPSENNTERYVNFVSDNTGYDRDSYVIDVSNPSIINVAQNMSILEGMKGFTNGDILLGYMIWEYCYMPINHANKAQDTEKGRM